MIVVASRLSFCMKEGNRKTSHDQKGPFDQEKEVGLSIGLTVVSRIFLVK